MSSKNPEFVVLSVVRHWKLKLSPSIKMFLTKIGLSDGNISPICLRNHVMDRKTNILKYYCEHECEWN